MLKINFISAVLSAVELEGVLAGCWLFSLTADAELPKTDIQYGLETFPNIFGAKKDLQLIVWNIFHTISDSNIFGSYTKYIKNYFFPNVLENNYE